MSVITKDKIRNSSRKQGGVTVYVRDKFNVFVTWCQFKSPHTLCWPSLSFGLLGSSETNPNYLSSSPPEVITGFQSTRPLTPLNTNRIVNKHIFVAVETAAVEHDACRSGVCHFYQTCTERLNSMMALDVDAWNLAVIPTAPHTVKSWMIFTAEAVSASVFAGFGCQGKPSEMFGSGGCFCGRRVKWE